MTSNNIRFYQTVVLVLGLAAAAWLIQDRPLSDLSTPDNVQEASLQHPLAEKQEYKNIVQLQEAFIRNARQTKPSVVGINKVLKIVRQSSWHDPDPHEPKPWYAFIKDWLVSTVGEKKFRVENVGSGVLLNTQGYILTNHHVIKDVPRLLIKLSNGKDYYAKVIGIDPMTDLAVLKIASFRKLVRPVFGKSRDVHVGEWVMAIGNPYGLEGTVTVGVVSGQGRTDLGITTFENFIQTDASINPGNSGGPLINLEGEIIGINTAVAEIGSGVGFAIPIDMALKVADELIEQGEVARGWLGVSIQSLTPELASSFQIQKVSTGVLVNSVENKTPAKDAGLLRGDIIVQFDGRQVLGSKKFQMMVAQTRIGKVVTIKIIRNGSEKTVRAKIGRLSS